MGIREKLEQWFPPSQHPSYYPIEEECGDISPDVWRESPLPDDPELRERHLRLKGLIFDAAFGTPSERRTHGVKCLPFNELPPEALDEMPPPLRQSYDAELAVAMDPRSGRVVRPYEPRINPVKEQI